MINDQRLIMQVNITKLQIPTVTQLTVNSTDVTVTVTVVISEYNIEVSCAVKATKMWYFDVVYLTCFLRFL